MKKLKSNNVLLLCPQPFFQERGSPIAVKLVAEALCKAGYQVDLLTYHEGVDLDVGNLRICRIPKLPFVNDIPIGFSWKKAISDIFVVLYMVILMKRKPYDIVHAVEEAIFPALIMKRFNEFKLIYDMDSSMPDQLVGRYPVLKALSSLLLNVKPLL